MERKCKKCKKYKKTIEEINKYLKEIRYYHHPNDRHYYIQIARTVRDILKDE